MPKLAGIEDKYWGKYKIDKENENTIYSDDEHVYIDKNDNSQYISVTTLIGKYTQEFDEEFWSSYKALESIMDPEVFAILKKTLLATKKFNKKLLPKFNIDENLFNLKQAEIKASYAQKRDESCIRGTAIHAMFENSFYGKKKFDFNKYGFKDLVGDFDCKKNYYKLDLDSGVYPEFLISLTSRDGLLKVAGQIDLLIKKGNDIWIIDWKGLDINTLIPTVNGFVKMGDLKEGDYVYDKNGRKTKVIHKSEVHYNPCYKITFDNGDSVVADIDHRWLVGYDGIVKTTRELLDIFKDDDEELLRIYNASPISGNSELYKSTIAVDYSKYFEKDTLEEVQNKVLFAPYEARVEAFNTIVRSNSTTKLGPYKYLIRAKYEVQCEWLCRLISSLGIKTNVSHNEDWIISFNTNPFIRKSSVAYRRIINIERVETIPTQCIEVDSPSHTYLCTERFIVTHNTNKEIKKESYYNRATKRREMMKPPLNNLMDTNFWHYTLQLSTYGYLLQQINPDFNIRGLKLVHIDHDDKQHEYDCEYLKDDVERMLKHYKRKLKIAAEYAKLKPVIT